MPQLLKNLQSHLQPNISDGTGLNISDVTGLNIIDVTGSNIREGKDPIWNPDRAWILKFERVLN